MIFHPTNKTLSRYMDRELPEGRQKRIARHLEKCSSCRRKLELLDGLGSCLAMEKPQLDEIRKGFMNRLEDRERIKTPVCGEIRAVIGTVFVDHGKKEQALEAFPGMALRQGDTVRVAEGSLALFELTDGSVFYLNRETEFHLSGSGHPINLRVGEFFAMMKPQSSVFRIKTPSAVLGVIGTDFNTRVTKEKKTMLQVLKGRVSFENEAGRVVVKKKRQVEASTYSRPEPARIIHSRSIGDWRNQIKPVNGKKGSAMNKLLVWILVLGMAAGAWFYFGKGSGGNHPVTSEDIEILEGETGPLGGTSPYTIEGFAWRTTTQSDSNGNFKMVIRTEVIEADEKRGSTMLLILEDAGGQGEMMELAKQSLGKKYVFRVTPEGNIRDIGTYSGVPLQASELSIVLNALGTSEVFGVIPEEPKSPGESWTNTFDAEIPDFPGFFLNGQAAFVFSGYQKREGKEVAVIKSETNISLGGITIDFSPNPKVRVVLEIHNNSIQVQRECIIDRKTRRVIGYTGIDREYDKRMSETQYITGRRVPIRRDIKDQESLTRISAIIEYLD